MNYLLPEGSRMLEVFGRQQHLTREGTGTKVESSWGVQQNYLAPTCPLLVTICVLGLSLEVLICLVYYNKVSQHGEYISNRNLYPTVLGAGRSQMKALVNLVSGKGILLGS